MMKGSVSLIARRSLTSRITPPSCAVFRPVQTLSAFQGKSAAFTNNNNNSVIIQSRSLASTTSSSSNKDEGLLSKLSPLNWWKKRQEAKQEEKFKDKIKKMANSETWTIGDFALDLQESLNTWKAKVPVVSNTKEVKDAKKIYKLIEGVIDVTGKDAVVDDLIDMSRTQKLKAAIAGESSVEDVNMFIQQFESVSLMHRVVRDRKLNDLPLPDSVTGITLLMRTEASKYLTKSQKEKAKALMKDMGRRSGRK